MAITLGQIKDIFACSDKEIDFENSYALLRTNTGGVVCSMSSWKSGTELSDDYARIQISYSNQIRESVGFPIPSVQLESEENIISYFHRCRDNLKGNRPSSITVLKCGIYSESVLHLGVILLPVDDSVWITSEGTDSLTIIGAYVDHHNGGGISKVHEKFYINNEEIRHKKISPPQWLRDIERQQDLYKSPTNSCFWEQIPYIENIDTYFGEYLYDVGKGTGIFLKAWKSVWVPVEYKWLEYNYEALPPMIREEFKMLQNIRLTELGINIY
ncbi:hypothetical protein [Paenibacillus odorifer]|uniref:hypothetical protein n=1 Tax=Paenibacillus odorifer TaxID=189426 RepID=UPI00096C1351|nr:hypothetical protein [Paenibacillus odorifer]OMD61038.1 hypothetical protein BSK55_06780 [Paenibacillus odorifer]